MNYVVAILVFGLMILVHELGHFIVAKLSGVAVVQFTIGFGPAIIKKKYKGRSMRCGCCRSAAP